MTVVGNNWLTDKIVNLPISLIDGDRSSKYPKRSEFKDDGVVFLNAESISGGRFNLSKVNYLSHKKYEQITKGRLQVNDIVLTMRGNGVGDAALFSIEDIEGLINAQMLIVRPNPAEINPQFLYYQLTNPAFKQLLMNFVTGSAQPQLTITHLRHVPLVIPPLNEQKSIAQILGNIDDKIELNRQMNVTLEAMAQALFKSWFIDFDPVIDNALAAGNPIPEPLHARAEIRKALGDQCKPLPEAIQKQFPNRFVFSEEMGWVPEEWEPTSLDKVANYQNGLALQKFRPEDENNFLPVVKIAQLKKGFADGEEKASPNIKPECIIDNGDVVFSWSGSLVVDVWCGGKAALNQHLFKVTSKDYPKWFFYEYTKHHLEEFQRIAADKAVTMGHIKREHLSQAMCIVPSNNLLDDCTAIVESLLDRHIGLRKQDAQLASIRDALLPKLISGQLRIPDAEKQLADAI